ncbi:hypothetical protein BHE74_00014228 [Ensete ventricosum]|nr:hypothetical protein GW17_00047333 [Ensete ventricosum]RWW77605.1 hypothetical protein BHE74_00014228 [Ensete ventricosum]RZR78829.1 hypothetical protein BHM03_00004368 [Ensete ventricosum]
MNLRKRPSLVRPLTKSLLYYASSAFSTPIPPSRARSVVTTAAAACSAVETRSRGLRGCRSPAVVSWIDELSTAVRSLRR